jgi:hypothetical protein
MSQKGLFCHFPHLTALQIERMRSKFHYNVSDNGILIKIIIRINFIMK